MLVLIILVYACCHSIRETFSMFLNSSHLYISNLRRGFGWGLGGLVLSLDEGLVSRTYFNVKELLVSAGGERR